MEESEFPPNSRIKKETKVEEEKKVVEKVVTGKVSRRKTPLSKRLKELFVGGDTHSVGSYILFDVLVPAAKDTIADAISQGIERMLFGDARSSSRRTGLGPRAHGGHVQYNRYTSSTPP